MRHCGSAGRHTHSSPLRWHKWRHSALPSYSGHNSLSEGPALPGARPYLKQSRMRTADRRLVVTRSMHSQLHTQCHCGGMCCREAAGCATVAALPARRRTVQPCPHRHRWSLPPEGLAQRRRPVPLWQHRAHSTWRVRLSGVHRYSGLAVLLGVGRSCHGGSTTYRATVAARPVQ